MLGHGQQQRGELIAFLGLLTVIVGIGYVMWL